MIVGTVARDLVLVHGFDAKIERGTRDVDFGICVEFWDQFHNLATNLIAIGFIQDDPELVLPVCAPAGIALLKLIAWLDRESDKRRKDATDLLYLISTYSKIPSVYDALYEEGFMDAQDYDELKACLRNKA